MSEQPRVRSSLPQVDAVIFDLDGTLWDTCEICARGWNNVIERYGLQFRKITAADVRGVVGRPHEQCVRDVCVGLPEADLKLLSDESEKEDNRLLAERGGILYPGVAPGLAALAARYPLYIVSNCQAGYIEIFLASTGLGPLFRDFECWGNTGRPKADNLGAVIRRNQLSAPLFVGDTPGDQAAALANDVPFVFAGYGFGTCSGARADIASFSQLCHLLLG